MAIQLAPELEQRIEALMARRGYESPDSLVEAALQSLEHSEADMEALVEEGLNSKLIVADDAYWAAFRDRTDQIRQQHEATKGSE